MTATSPPAAQHLRAIVFCDVSASSAHHMKQWIESGHHICACVISHKPKNSRWRRDRLRRVLAPAWSFAHILRRYNIPLIRAPRNLSDEGFVARMGSFNADVLISTAFPQRIPEVLTSRFRCGGVNLHPALLPEYRGPHPVLAMAVDNTLHKHGGVTVHCIVHGLDEGDIIAQAAMTADDLAEPELHSISTARIGAELLVGAVPAFCAGDIKARPQPEGSWRYASLVPDDLVLSPELGVAETAMRAKVLGSLGRLRLVVDGKPYAIGGVARTSDKRTGAPPRITPMTIEMDVRDGRVRLFRQTRLLRRMRDIRMLHRLWKAARLDANRMPT